MDNLCCLSPESATLLATSIALELGRDKSAAEILAIRNLFNQVTQTLYTMYSQQLYLKTNCTCKPEAEPPKSERKTAGDPTVIGGNGK